VYGKNNSLFPVVVLTGGSLHTHLSILPDINCCCHVTVASVCTYLCRSAPRVLSVTSVVASCDHDSWYSSSDSESGELAFYILVTILLLFHFTPSQQ